MPTRRQLFNQFQKKARLSGWDVAEEGFPAAIESPFFPAQKDIFKALEMISPEKVKYLIVGQDPYFTCRPDGTPDATGIAFAVKRNTTVLPGSLKPIMKKVYEGGQGRPDLADWIQQKGILLLNAALTVPRPVDGQRPGTVARKHLKLWHDFTKSIILQLRRRNPHAQLVAWGDDAREVICDALEESGAFTSCRHPSRPSESFAQFWQTGVGNSLKMDPVE